MRGALRAIVICTLCILFTAPAFGADSLPESMVRIELIALDADRVQFDIRTQEPNVEQVAAGGQTWDRLILHGASTQSQVGAPELPTVTRMIRLGATDTVVAQVEILEAEPFHGLDIRPFQIPAMRDGSDTPPFTIDPQVYNASQMWPASLAHVGSPVIMHGIRMAPVSVTPFQYNPATGDGLWVSSVRVTLRFRDSRVDNPLPENSPGRTRVFQQIVDSLMLAPGYTPSGTDIDPMEHELYDGAYLIVTDPDFTDEVMELAQWKQRKGLHVELVTTDQTGDSASEIRQFIEDRYYHGEYSLDYVLLVGDVQQIPTHYGIDDTANDNGYATLEGSDYLPDVIVGRISVQTAAEARVAVSKMIRYEASPEKTSNGWVTSALMISGSDKVDDQNAGYCGQLAESEGGFDTVDYLFASNNENTLSNVLASMEKGRTWVTYFGHGSTQSWKSVSPTFDTRTVRSLDNDSMLPVITSIACSNGAFDASDESFAETWIKDDSNRGAAAVFAASRATPFVYTDSLGKGVSEGTFAHGLSSYGAAAVFGKLKMYTDFPEGEGSYTHLVTQQFHVFGDPELNVWSARPTELELEYPEMIDKDETELSVTVYKDGQPFPGATVHLFRFDEFSLLGDSNANGEIHFTLPNELLGMIELTVTGHNVVPETKTIEVDGVTPPDDNFGSTDEDGSDGWFSCGG